MEHVSGVPHEGGTGRAYLSTGNHDSRPYRDAGQAACAAELARILGETEDDDTPFASLGRERSTYIEACEADRALAESLAAVTADGGPLDSLALDSAMAAGELLTCSRNMYHFNSVTIGVDPVIIAAQRDLAVLSAYAQQVRA